MTENSGLGHRGWADEAGMSDMLDILILELRPTSSCLFISMFPSGCRPGPSTLSGREKLVLSDTILMRELYSRGPKTAPKNAVPRAAYFITDQVWDSYNVAQSDW